MKSRVFVSRPLPAAPMAFIRQHCRVDVWTGDGAPPLQEKIANIDGLVTYGHEPVTADFSIPGLGKLAINGINLRDFPVVLINLITDLLYSLADPRIRYG